MSTRILIVDDDTDCARFLTEAIEAWGFEVVATSNGREGLDVFHSMPIDGICLDLEMPVMNGWTMLDELRWLGSGVPVIVMSKEADFAKLQNFLMEGAQDYLVKPLNRLLLLQKLFRHFPWGMGAENRPALFKDKPREVNVHQEKDALLAQSGAWLSERKCD